MGQEREDYFKRLEALRNERSTWIEHWRECGEYVKPRNFRFLYTDRNKGWKKNSHIINNTATRALRTMAAGMMAGITSPARPWFRLGTRNTELDKKPNVRAWLDLAEAAVRDTLQGSNVYNALHKVYEALGQFGTAVLHVDEDVKDTVRAYVFPVGQYLLASSARGAVDTVYREFSMTVGQLVEKFGEAAVSGRVRSAYKDGRRDEWVQVLHVVEPNPAQLPGAMGKRGMAFRSRWMERTQETGGPDFLREGGYNDLPIMAPRWNVTAEDVYGESPGMDALGDIKALQLLERRKAQLVDKLVDPPMRAPTSLMHQRASLLPGSITYVDSNQPGQVFAPALEMPPAGLGAIEQSIREHESRINATFYADLWLMLAQREEAGDAPQMTAREVAERHEEKMLQLGPVLESLERELLGPLIDRVFSVVLRTGRLGVPPKELHGQNLAIEYLSIMSVAQKMLSNGSLERYVGFLTQLSQLNPEVVDVVDLDEMARVYGDNLSVPSSLERAPEQVQALRQQRAKMQQQQHDAEVAAQQAKAAQSLSGADMGGDNLLSRLAGPVAGAEAGDETAPNMPMGAA